MAVKWIGANWRTDLSSKSPPKDRIYIDFRQIHYPPFNSDLTYTLNTSADNNPGTYYVSGGDAEYFLDLPDTLTIWIRARANFGFDTASDQPLLYWTIDGTHYLGITYANASDQVAISWIDGGTVRSLAGAVHANNTVLQTMVDYVVTLDLASGVQTDSVFYENWSSADADWGGASDTISSNFPIMHLRENGLGTNGDWDIAFLKVWPNRELSAAEVANYGQDVLDEEIYWPLDNHGLGKTRCNVTSHVMDVQTNRIAFSPQDGQSAANKLSVILNSDSGEFADDQYAAFDAPNSVYNGTSAQAYMKQRTPVMLESWYQDDFDSVFVGRVSPEGYVRSTPVGGKSTVIIDCDDQMADVAFKYPRKGKKYESKKISDATETDSLIHLITRLATQEDVYNYLANSSFENATIADSWTVAGAGATFTKQAGGLIGSNQGDLVYGAAICNVSQTITFAGGSADKYETLNVGQSFTFQVWLKSASNCSYNLRLAENDSVGENDNTEAVWTCAAGEGWTFHSVTHTITDSDSDRLICYVYLDDNVTLSMDCAMLIKYDRALRWFVLNDNDGASGVESAGDADNDTYDTCGFDCDAVNITHTWQHIDPGDSIVAHVKDLGLATVADYCGFDSAGTFKLRSYFKTGYADPTPILTISGAQDITAAQEVDRANKIIVHGVRVEKYSQRCKAWDAEKIGFTGFYDDGDKVTVTLANGAEWPDPATYGEPFMARYNK